MKNDLNYLCKDCKHSFVPLADRIVSFGFPSDYNYKCSKAWKPDRIIDNPVVGQQKAKGEFNSCHIARLEGHDCGPKARQWMPKHKKDLFKALTRESYD